MTHFPPERIAELRALYTGNVIYPETVTATQVTFNAALDEIERLRGAIEEALDANSADMCRILGEALE